MTIKELVQLIKEARGESDPYKQSLLWDQVREALSGQFNKEDHSIDTKYPGTSQNESK